MAENDLLARVGRVGKMAEARALIEEHLERATADYKIIRSDSRWADDYRKKELARAYVGHKRQLDAKLEALASSGEKSMHGDVTRLFGIDGISGDRGQLAISRRDAGDRVAKITSPSELAELLQRAERTGDETLARACAERALDLRQPEVMQSFLDRRPELDAIGERVWNHQQNDGFDLPALMGRSAMKPNELNGTMDSIIEAMAAE